MTEAELQHAVIQLAHMLGWHHMHARRSRGKGGGWTTATNVPWVDLTLWHPRKGGVLFRELKRDERSVWQPGQREVLEGLRAAGADADVWTVDDLTGGRVQRELMANRKVPA